MIDSAITIRKMGSQVYLNTWESMKKFTSERNENTLDEIWILEHPPIFTQGQNGKPEHLINPGDIPTLQVDRGGQVTYHGPGQCVIYTLLDLKRKKFTIRQLVCHLEKSVIDLLGYYGITAYSKNEAPGVYVENKKICSIGLRVRRGCAYHGIALNVDMDLQPFNRINPCGFPQLEMTQISAFGIKNSCETVAEKLIPFLLHNLGYTNALYAT